jgi:branched-chain amino acid transport system ATP-binding protein
VSGAPVLALERVTVRFGGVVAVDDITISVPEGIVFGLIGPNGAGKTTLFNTISGFVRSSGDGRILFNGQNIRGLPVDKVAKLGIGRTFQNIALLRERTVRDNLLLGLHLALTYHPLATLLPSRRIARAEAEARRQIEEVADMLHIARAMLDSTVDTLSVGQQKKVEVARAVLRKPTLLLLDEPAGGLNDRETVDLKVSLETLRKRSPFSVVLVDHDMNLVMDLCERIAVLDRGSLVAEGSPDEIRRNDTVIKAYLGHG